MRESLARDDIMRVRGRTVADILRLQARRNPDRIALVYEGCEDSFATLDETVTRTANALRAAGVETGDRVAILSHNNRPFVILRFAIIRAGAIFVPVNFMLNSDEVAYILYHSGPRALIVEDALCDVADAAMATLESPPAIRAYIPHTDMRAPVGWTEVTPWFAYTDASPPEVLRDEEDVAQIMYTSGTEARPKGAQLTSRALLTQYVSCIADGSMSEDDVELHCLPLYHCAQLDCFLSVDLFIGAKSVLLRAPDPARILSTIEQQRITKLFCPPTVWIALLGHPDFERCDLSSLKKGYYGASVMPVAVIEELSRRLPEIRLWNFYGQTEMSPVATILKPEDQLTRLGSAGRPALNVETRVVDENDEPLPIGEVGEIVHRSPQAMLGYLNDAEQTSAAFRNGWFHSGDLGRFDEAGYLYVVDRKKDMIKSGGENVASSEVEGILFRHPAVSEAAVFGTPDPRWIEAVTAVIVLKDGAQLGADEIHAYCRAQMASYKRPKIIHFADKLPKNASGKVLKRELRQLYMSPEG